MPVRLDLHIPMEGGTRIMRRLTVADTIHKISRGPDSRSIELDEVGTGSNH